MITYSDIIIPIGSTFKSAIIKSDGSVAFKVAPQNGFDSGDRSAKNGEYKILSIADATFGLGPAMDVNGFSVKEGNRVDIELTMDVVNSIATGSTYVPPPADSTNGGNEAPATKPLLTTKNIVIGIIVIVVIIGILKYNKVF